MRQEKSFLWCSAHPNHYHQYLLECIQKKGIGVDALYFSKVISRYPWQSDFSHQTDQYLEKGFLGIDWKFIRSRKWVGYKWVLVAGWNEPTMILLLLLMMASRRKFILYSDTPDPIARKGLKQALRSRWLSLIFRNASYIFSTGKPGVNWFLQAKVPSRKLVNFPFLTNLTYFKPAQPKVVNPVPVIFASGRLDNNDKGYDVALEALSAMHQKGFQFMYRIAGEGPDRAKITAEIDRLSLTEKVVLLGWLEPESVLREYQQADIFLHASRFDPFPNAVLESMAVGLPVVCSDMAGSGLDRIEQGVNGLLFKSGDARDLANQLHTMLSYTTAEREQMGKMARKTAGLWDFNYHTQILQKILDEQ